MGIVNFAAPIPTSANTVEAAMLKDGRIIVLVGPSPIEVYNPAGSLLGRIDPYQGGAGIIPNAGGHIVALADGGFVVTGQKDTEIAFRIYNDDLSERTNGPVAIATPGFFNGGYNFGHVIKPMPGGGFVVEWITNEGSLPAGQLGVTSGGTPIFEGGSGPQGTSVDVRSSIFDANGALTSPARFLVTQGIEQLPGYAVDSRFGQQYVNDIDVLSTGEIVTTIYGQRWSPPSGGDENGTFSTGYYFDSFRINNGATGAEILGETPYNTESSNFQNVANNFYGPSQTVVLNTGMIAGIFTVDAGVPGQSAVEIRLQLMNADGTPEGGSVDLGLAFDSSFLQPQLRAIATESGGFVVAYVAPASPVTAGDASSYNVYAREYSGAGTLISTEQITTATGYEQLNGLVQGPDGTYMVTSSIVGAANASTSLFVLTNAGDEVINGGGGAETLSASGANKSWIFSGGGADTINGGSGINYLYGSTGDTVFNGGAGVNIMRGGSGNELMLGGAQADTLDGGGGHDTLIGDGPLSLTSAAQSVRRLYIATLDRGPDEAGWADWTAKLEGGQSLDTVAAGFVNSDEFGRKYGNLTNSEFVTQVYRNVLDREPDSGGFQAYTNALDGGSLSRTGLVTSFSESDEFRAATSPELHAGQVYRLYGATLARQPDAGGFESWTDALGEGRSLVDVAAGFVGSQEFQIRYGGLDNTGFVTLLYQNVLGRAPDQAGLADWVGRLDGNLQTRTQVVTGFSNSQEYVNTTSGAVEGFMRNVMTAWSDTLFGGPGSDRMTGGRGSDRYEFQAGDGADFVYGFESFDTLQLRGFGFQSSDEALAAMTQQGEDVVLSRNGSTITFEATQLGVLQSVSQQGWILG